MERDFDLEEGDVVCIENHRPMEIRLLNDEDYQKFKEGIVQYYHYGQYDPNSSPIRLTIPSTGHWHIVITGYEDGVPPRITIK